MIRRLLSNRIDRKIGSGKAIMIIGPRQVGKTTLIKEKLKDQNVLFLDGDDPTIRKILDTINTENLRNLIGNYKTIFIDEAQRINQIGLTLKIITDQFKDVQLWISGSSSFTLSHQLNEPLTGRKWEYEMLPICWEEFENHFGYVKAEQTLDHRLLYGFYPDVINNPGDEVEVLKNLVNSYLYRDILSYAEIRKPEILEKLVQALALQIGSEVNYNELSQTVGIDKNTVQRYIDILEKGYVIFKLSSFSSNLRNEIKKNKKIYFYDNGIRNMVIGNFTDISSRKDKGALWENFLISERIKQNTYKLTLAKPYFWRTSQQQEVDYVEEVSQQIYGYEFKWNPKKKGKLPKTFLNAYNAKSHIINRENFRNFVTIKQWS
ncbi:ATP-binding protein [Aquimarina sp. ERC-38]|uniref:ATP-binding protein n=1 Tax=Aquimarina sp. ERC-38 TaxID=2949996 RepID=UPI0022483BBA|nr:ATP-binding protein [Aquimarina sp. ERC-38]UZO81021.1 ATP-binding protein [Aquimarina sp. ERC-38]